MRNIASLMLDGEDKRSNEFKEGWNCAISFINDNFKIENRNGEEIGIVFNAIINEDDLIKKLEKVKMQNNQEEIKTEDEKLTDVQIKNKLKKMNKSDLSRIVINLSARVDKHIAHNKEVKDAVEKMKSNCEFIIEEDGLKLLEIINKEVK